MTQYFEMKDDVYVPGRWFLTDPTDSTGSDLRYGLGQGKPLQLDGPVRIHFNEFAKRGNPVDYCELDAVGVAIPVIHVRVATVFSALARNDVQLFQAVIEGVPEQFCVLNVIREFDCIDDKASEVAMRYTLEDGEIFADRIGEFRSVYNFRIKPTSIPPDVNVCRTWGWRSIVVSERVKQGLEEIGTSGVRFKPV